LTLTLKNNKICYDTLRNSGKRGLIMADPWMTVKDVAKYLQLSMDMIYKMAQQGKLPASKIGAQWRFKREEIDEWVRAQRPRVWKEK
jgi:excisionase family DNA binding protein